MHLAARSSLAELVVNGSKTGVTNDGMLAIRRHLLISHLQNSRGSLGSGSRLDTRRRLGAGESADNAGSSGQNNNDGLGEHFEEFVGLFIKTWVYNFKNVEL